MDVETVRMLYGYDHWVNQRLLATVEQVATERLREPLGASFGSIHGTLAHLLGVQIMWLSRWRGVSPTTMLGADDFQDLPDLRVRWREHQQEMDAFLAGLTPARLAAPLRYSRPTGESYELPLWQLMVHVVNHGTHHRSELADMLTRVGNPPQPTDLVRYFQQFAGQGQPER